MQPTSLSKGLHPPLLRVVAAVLLLAWAQQGGPTASGRDVSGPGGPEEVRGTGSAKRKIVPFLWFDDDAEAAVRFYSSIFPDAEVLSETRIRPNGALLSARFQLAGQEFIALNGGPMYSFTEAISLFVECESQEEVDDLWAKLTAGGGQPGRCGWLKDKYGLSWQVIPTALGEMLRDKDAARAKRVAEAIEVRCVDLAPLRSSRRWGKLLPEGTPRGARVRQRVVGDPQGHRVRR